MIGRKFCPSPFGSSIILYLHNLLQFNMQLCLASLSPSISILQQAFSSSNRSPVCVYVMCCVVIVYFYFKFSFVVCFNFSTCKQQFSSFFSLYYFSPLKSAISFCFCFLFSCFLVYFSPLRLIFSFFCRIYYDVYVCFEGSTFYKLLLFSGFLHSSRDINSFISFTLCTIILYSNEIALYRYILSNLVHNPCKDVFIYIMLKNEIN